MDTSGADAITVREALPGDAAALARLHADVARYYQQSAPHYFRAAAGEGVAVDDLDMSQGVLRLVAEVEGEVVGALAARLIEPRLEDGEPPRAPRGETRLRIDYLATAADRRRGGIGTLLVQAAETWGRQGGAAIVETTTFQGSPLSVPFWEDRMGYEELSTTLEKRL